MTRQRRFTGFKSLLTKKTPGPIEFQSVAQEQRKVFRDSAFQKESLANTFPHLLHLA